ncbi:PREDICTED: insulin-degrading enzyme-like 1, peroxisomal isoform X2 [Theobroma cacao]|uniref:Insulin-degrading enzyme-like 1, peroxisomal isoform X2 n=1 Tax=Theobroma cacao TaxID=3641 RepID=A0AB32WBT6_THECC|nr:PREDICTED: insulin-degrading enzyme-like 1, peroxisomal isoform X2 [Theobroma cacao]
MANVTEIDEEILKPRTDKRQYRRIVLGNSLQVLLVSDLDTDKSAACMRVSIGYFSDPDGCEGLAHLLMRALLLAYASETYPGEDSYSQYIIEHGGYTEGAVSSNQTNYHFNINNDCFEEALERFSQLFNKPLMSTEAAMREIKTVESAYQNYLLSDERRMHQLQKHLSWESHPYHRFGIGNWYTLDVRPKAKGLDIRQELLKFYEENYSANLMHLVLYTKESLDEIQNLVENKFQVIRNSNQRGFQSTGLPFKSEHLMILVKAVPIKERHKLTVAWPITPSRHHYKEGPCYYLTRVIGHKGEGSVYHTLQKLGWATGLKAGEYWWTSEFSFFQVIVALTDAGHEHMQDIVGLLFKYIQLLKQTSVCKRVFEELSAVCETKFHYPDKIQPLNYVIRIASNMEKYPPKDWLVGSSLLSNFNPDVVHMFLREFSPENVRIFWESKKFEGDTDKVEPWFGTAYTVEKITTSMIQKWMSSAPSDNLQLPAPNMFVPTNLSLKVAQEKVKFPVLLRKSSYSKLWYKPDTMFSVPKAFVKIEFNCPHVRDSPQAEVLANIFVQLLDDYLNEHAYDAEIAGLDYSISRTDRGFEVTVFGYNDKLNTLLESVVDKIANFEAKPDKFSITKEMTTKGINNFKYENPSLLAIEYCSLILRDIRWPWKEKLDVLPHLEVEDLVKFTPIMFSRVLLECFIAGNMERDEAISIIQHVESIFFGGSNPKCQPLFPSLHLTNEVVKFGRGVSYLYSIQGLNPNNENSALLHYIQVHRDDFILNVKLQLFCLIAKEPAYHQLSSIEQLGYINDFYRRIDFGIHGVVFLIQSTVKNPRDIDSRVEAFLEMFENKINEMTNDEFRRNVNALIDIKLEKHKNLREESGFYWREIINGTLKFDRREAEVEALRQVTQQEFIDFFNEYIKVGSHRKKTLSVRVYGKKHLSEYRSEKSEPLQMHSLRIDDILSFRRSQPHYGSFKGSFSNMKL